MNHKLSMKPVAFALGAALVTTLPIANAADNPFAMTELSSGYMVADAAEGKCGEGKCGAGKSAASEDGDKAAKEGKCGEGKCGAGKSAATEGGD